ncbi:MAG: hypothetical protein EOO91_04830 [Pedobacter sp.]|nr:MAG: hypothetical protein EOO91_04830 [Pedobacter sp.]
MKKQLYLLIAMLLLFSNSFGQQAKFPAKIKVILLGTFHYGETSDKKKTAFTDLFSQKRQAELVQLVKDIAKENPTKIFVESQPVNQQKLNNEYELYQKNQLTDTVILRNEIQQIGFRLAKLAKLPAPIAVDYKQELPYDEMNKFEKGIGADTTIKWPPFFDIPYPFTDTTKKISLKKMSLPQYYVGLNSEYQRKSMQFDYLHYAMSYGYKDNYVGADFTTSWYNRNLKIYTNILRELKPTDTCIVVLFGASHTNLLRQFFADHPSFEIIELDKILKP